MKIEVNIDASGLLRRLPKYPKRLAYATVNAINQTLRLIQKEERGRVEAEFTVRKKEFILRSVAKIKPFASVPQTRPYGEVAVDEKPRLLLSKFERGGTRKPSPGSTYIAAPVVGGPARPTFGSTVPTELRMKRLNFERTKTGKARKAVREAGVYLIPDVGIFKRTGPQTSEPVYFFFRSQVLAPRLRFLVTAKKVTDKWFREFFQREVVKAVSHSRGEGL